MQVFRKSASFMAPCSGPGGPPHSLLMEMIERECYDPAVTLKPYITDTLRASRTGAHDGVTGYLPRW